MSSNLKIYSKIKRIVLIFKDTLAEIKESKPKDASTHLSSPSQTLAKKFAHTHAELADMSQQIAERKKLLALQLDALEFERESVELLAKMSAKRALAQSEEYGQDYEHLTLIRAKFATLHDEVNAFETRHVRLKHLGAHLLSAKFAESKQVRKRIDELKSTRELLAEDLRRRDLVLNSAAEIHRFNKDVQELLRRISDKELALSAVASDIGKDFRTCAHLQRKHETFVDELSAALKPQLHELNKQSEQLRAQHPGDTAESVAAEMDELVDRFGELWLSAERRTRELAQAIEFFKFVACVRDVNEWMEETRKALLARLNLPDLFAVTAAKEELDNLSFEMTQRDDVFKVKLY